MADFLKTSSRELDYENLKESNISEVITKLGNNPEETSDKLFRF